MKICKDCKTTPAASKNSRCNPCRRKNDEQLRREDPQRWWARRRLWSTPKKAGLDMEFLLGLGDSCWYCSKPVNWRRTKQSADSPTLDRVNPKSKYRKYNVVLCCWRCNKLKSDGTKDELKKIVEGIERFEESKG